MYSAGLLHVRIVSMDRLPFPSVDCLFISCKSNLLPSSLNLAPSHPSLSSSSLLVYGKIGGEFPQGLKAKAM